MRIAPWIFQLGDISCLYVLFPLMSPTPISNDKIDKLGKNDLFDKNIRSTAFNARYY